MEINSIGKINDLHMALEICSCKFARIRIFFIFCILSTLHYFVLILFLILIYFWLIILFYTYYFKRLHFIFNIVMLFMKSKTMKHPFHDICIENIEFDWEKKRHKKINFRKICCQSWYHQMYNTIRVIYYGLFLSK